MGMDENCNPADVPSKKRIWNNWDIAIRCIFSTASLYLISYSTHWIITREVLLWVAIPTTGVIVFWVTALNIMLWE